MGKKNQIIIVGLIGALLLVITFFIKDSTMDLKLFTYQALFNVSFILITIALVNGLWNLLGGEPLEKMLGDLRTSTNLLTDSSESGIIRYLSANDHMSSKEWYSVMMNAKSKLDILGYTLNTWSKIEGFEEEIVSSVKAGLNVRILFMDESNPHLMANINVKQISSMSKGIVSNEITTSTDFYSNIKAEIDKDSSFKGSFEYRKVKHGLVMGQICIFDYEAYITPYLHSITTPHSPMLIIKGSESKAFIKYQNEFDAMWKLNETENFEET